MRKFVFVVLPMLLLVALTIGALVLGNLVVRAGGANHMVWWIVLGYVAIGAVMAFFLDQHEMKKHVPYGSLPAIISLFYARCWLYVITTVMWLPYCVIAVWPEPKIKVSKSEYDSLKSPEFFDFIKTRFPNRKTITEEEIKTAAKSFLGRNDG